MNKKKIKTIFVLFILLIVFSYSWYYMNKNMGTEKFMNLIHWQDKDTSDLIFKTGLGVVVAGTFAFLIGKIFKIKYLGG